jgi:hypothetical protein
MVAYILRKDVTAWEEEKIILSFSQFFLFYFFLFFFLVTFSYL